MTSSPRPVAVVTGGGRGIGRAVVERLAADGFAVAIWDYHLPSGDALAAALRERGANAHFAAVDVRSAQQIDAALASTLAALGGLDVLVNNAGIQTPPAQLVAQPSWQLEVQLRVNLLGTLRAYRACRAELARSPRGRIINFGSIQSRLPMAGYTAYATAKAAIEALTLAWAAAPPAPSCTVNAICPGFIETRMNTLASPAYRARVLAGTPARRHGTPQDVAALVAFLASEEAAFLSGAVIAADGGLSARMRQVETG